MAPNRMEDYSLYALQRELNREGVFEIRDYCKVTDPCGYTKISYHEYVGSATHFKYAMFFPASAITDLMIRAFQEERQHYFHTRDNVYLGKSAEDASERANEIGELKTRAKEYGKASSYFSIAHHLCRDSRRRSFLEKANEAEDAEKAGEREREGEERERMKQEAAERVRRIELEGIERDAKERVARSYCRQAIQLWNQTFIVRRSNDATDAKRKLLRCKKLLSEAAELVPNDSLCQSWLRVLELEEKILFEH